MAGSMIVAVYSRLEPPGKKQYAVVSESFLFLQDFYLPFT